MVAELLDDLETHQDTPTLVPEETAAANFQIGDNQPKDADAKMDDPPDEWRLKNRVLCMPGRDLLGEAFALIIAQLVSKEGIGARAEDRDALSISKIFTLDTKDVGIVCLCFIGDTSAAQIHYAVRRLRRKMPKAFILLTLIGNATAFEETFMSAAGIGSIQTSLRGTRDEILKIVKASREQVARPLKIVG